MRMRIFAGTSTSPSTPTLLLVALMVRLQRINGHAQRHRGAAPKSGLDAQATARESRPFLHAEQADARATGRAPARPTGIRLRHEATSVIADGRRQLGALAGHLDIHVLCAGMF